MAIELVITFRLGTGLVYIEYVTLQDGSPVRNEGLKRGLQTMDSADYQMTETISGS